jgi:hypothetical protein
VFEACCSIFLNTSLKAVRLQEDTQINKAASLTNSVNIVPAVKPTP